MGKGPRGGSSETTSSVYRRVIKEADVTRCLPMPETYLIELLSEFSSAGLVS